MTYQSVEIINSTNYIISGEISYMTVFCRDTEFILNPYSAWQSQKRICPIVEITAFIKTPDGFFTAKPFISIGTTHQTFEVIQTEKQDFRVIKARNVKVKSHPQILQPIL
ncbi:hypothetical protein [Epilithonimonas sp. UC225_85]|uniref:hypothetical protein n=1 Tax=Epilithonimonas sp. UC225_85 TaxID=3350167 RepID=UPI0036D3C9C4